MLSCNDEKVPKMDTAADHDQLDDPRFLSPDASSQSDRDRRHHDGLAGWISASHCDHDAQNVSQFKRRDFRGSFFDRIES
jgi:hypothetical protein